ncbi:hypothetical protein BGY98DRAFT_1004325 [Russula aff. rugulosa BPL654]|nr:hypothetical protein BGY98DRAFT_1004325 [Russula aff. rugulosa BPL654]
MRIFNFTLVAMLGYVAVVVGAIPLANGNRTSAAEDIDRRESSLLDCPAQSSSATCTVCRYFPRVCGRSSG